MCTSLLFTHTALSTTVAMEMDGAGLQPGAQTARLWQTISAATSASSNLETVEEISLPFLQTNLFRLEKVENLMGTSFHCRAFIRSHPASPSSRANPCLQVVLVTFVFLCGRFKSSLMSMLRLLPSAVKSLCSHLQTQRQPSPQMGGKRGPGEPTGAPETNTRC